MTFEPADIVRRLEQLNTCTVSDALDSMREAGAVSGLLPLWDCGRVAGRVHTVQLRHLEATDQASTATHLGARAIEASGPGDVIAVANHGRTDSAGWGGLLSVAASVRQVAAVVVDGACRDVEEAIAVGFPLFARASTPVSARGRTVEEASDVPVEIGGVQLSPGDFVIADRNGVAFVRETIALEIVGRAEDLVNREGSMLADLEQGVAASRVMDQRYESMLLGPPSVSDAAQERDGEIGGDPSARD